MGRKIPARKHRTVKDPYVQRAQQFAKVKNKINNPPSKTDFQEIPRSVLQIMKLKEKAKMTTVKKGRKKKDKNLFNMRKALGREKLMPGMEVPDKPIPIIEHKPHQSQQEYFGRVERMVRESIKESKYENVFGVDVKRDEEGRITEVAPRKAEKRSKKLRLSQKRKEKLKKKKEGKVEEKEFPKRENVEFGNIVHEPPANLTKPKKPGGNVSGDAFPKPGKRDLLLKKIVGDTTSASNKSIGSKDTKKARPKMSSIEKQKVEERRKLVVEAFRQSKRKGKLL